jgi:hypothetical protein
MDRHPSRVPAILDSPEQQAREKAERDIAARFLLLASASGSSRDYDRECAEIALSFYTHPDNKPHIDKWASYVAPGEPDVQLIPRILQTLVTRAPEKAKELVQLGWEDVLSPQRGARLKFWR